MIIDGESARQVAHERLYRPRKDDTVYAQAKRYQKQGLTGLQVRPG
jgi:hypothetical protein